MFRWLKKPPPPSEETVKRQRYAGLAKMIGETLAQKEPLRPDQIVGINAEASCLYDYTSGLYSAMHDEEA